jgi:glycosyltransferase involved in cell wall biosynthesis
MLVSIYIPTRNRRDLVERAVRSALDQDHREIEVIVVDDASTDDTASRLASIADTDSRLKFFVQEKAKGAPAARNRAINAAAGAFITGLDDDDYFHRSRIRKFVEAWATIQSSGGAPSCLYSKWFIMRDGIEAGVSKNPATASYQDMFRANVVGNQVFAPRETFLGVGLFDEKLPAWQDLDLFIRILHKYGTAYLVDEPTYYFDVTDRGDRISTKVQRVRTAMEMIRAKYPTLDRKLLFALFMQMFSGHYDIDPTWSDLGCVAMSRPSFPQLRLVARRTKSYRFLRQLKSGRAGTRAKN